MTYEWRRHTAERGSGVRHHWYYGCPGRSGYFEDCIVRRGGKQPGFYIYKGAYPSTDNYYLDRAKVGGPFLTLAAAKAVYRIRISAGLVAYEGEEP